MKKKILLLLIITMLIFATIAISFAMPVGISPINSDAFKQETVTPSSNYLPLNSPKHVSVSANYIVGASETQLFVYSNIDTTHKVFDITLAGAKLIDIANTDQYITVLWDTGNSTNSYKIYDITTGAAHPSDTTDLLSDNIDGIDADGENFYYRDIASLSKIDVTATEIHAEKVTFNSDTNKNIFNRSISFDVFNGEIYVYSKGKELQKLTQFENVTYITMDYITNFAVADNGIYYLKDGKINFCSFDKKIASPLDGAFSGIAASGSVAYSCDTKNNRINIYNNSDNKIIKSTEFLGDKGGEIDRFDTPTDISIYGDYIYIADSQNNRISVTNTVTLERSVITLESDMKALMLAVWDNRLGIIDNNILKVFDIDNGKLLPRYSHSLEAEYGRILDIECYQNNYMILAQSGAVILANDKECKVVMTLPGAKAISVSENSNYMYVAGENAVTRYNFMSASADKPIDVDNAGIQSFSIDFVGNFFALSDGQLKVYNRESNNYTLSKTFDINALSTTYKAKLQAKSGDMYIIDTLSHKLIRLPSSGIGSKSSSEMGFTHPDKSVWNIIKSGRITTDTIVFAAPNNDEAIQPVKENTEFLVLAEIDYENVKYAYGVIKGWEKQCYYINTSSLEMRETYDYPANHPTMMPIFPSGAKVYEFPFKGATTIATAPKSADIMLINNVSGAKDNHVWQWFKVKFKGENDTVITGYVDKNDIFYSSVVTPPKNRIFLKVQTSNFGEKAPVYKTPDENSEVAFEVSDGDKVVLGVEVFDTTAEFTKVIFNNAVGYIRTSFLLETGLTVGQVTIIVISSVCVVIFVLLIVLICLRRKIFKQKNSKKI